MGFDENIEMVRLAFYQVLISSGPFLGAALAIGSPSKPSENCF